MAYIDRETAIKTAVENYKCTNQFDVMEMVEAMEAMPTADVVEVKHGKWIMTVYTTVSPRGRYITNKKFSCSECKKSNGRYTMPYCPTCGAKMDGKGDA